MISPALFAIMVVMALVSTVMTTPLLEWIHPVRLVWAEAPPAGPADRRPPPSTQKPHAETRRR